MRLIATERFHKLEPAGEEHAGYFQRGGPSTLVTPRDGA
jgi:hypothetical protein